MTPEELQNAIDSAIERNEHHEVQQKKSWKWIVVAVTTALGGAGGTGAKTVIDSRTNEQFREAVARHVAEAKQRWEHSDKERDRLIDQVGALRETVAGLKATVEILAANRRRARESIAAVELPAASPASRPAPLEIQPDKVQAIKSLMFE